MTHEAGWAHAPGALHSPSWLRQPGNVNALMPQLWSQTAEKVDGELHVGGLAIPALVANVNDWTESMPAKAGLSSPTIAVG